MRWLEKHIGKWFGPFSDPPVLTPDSQRAFVLGSAVVDRGDMTWGHDPTQFSPEEYLHYLATSNGVFACVRLRSQLLSSLPIKFYKVGATGKRTEVTSGKVIELFTKVNPRWTFSRMVEMWESSLCLTGQTYAFMERGQAKRLPPSEMWWGRSDRVRVVPDPETYISGFLYEPMDGGTPIVYKPEEVFWARYPNPIDEFSGLAPLAAARLAADSAGDAMKSNRNLFINGIQMGGFVLPRQGMPMFTKEQADEASTALSRNAKGVDNAHRWQVFRLDADVKTLTMSPKDAEFLGLLKWSLEDICRAFGVPLDLVGGERTYANQKDARLAVWTDTIIPEARFLGTEITEQILPLFPNEADLAEFDSSEVPALREYEAQMWSIAKEKVAAGATTVNRYLKEKGEDPVPWGDDWWAPVGLVPVGGPMAAQAEKAAQEAAQVQAEALKAQQEANKQNDPNTAQSPQDGQDATKSPKRAHRPHSARAIEYGSAEHERIWTRAITRAEPWERKIGDTTAALMRSQRQSILVRLRKQDIRSVQPSGQRISVIALMEAIFSLGVWIRNFRVAAYTRSKDDVPSGFLYETVKDLGQQALDDLGLTISFDLDDPRVRRALQGQAQRFAVEVNQTTWDMLKAALAEGLQAGEGTDDLAKRVEAVMGSRIRSSGETIARTEIAAATTISDRESWRQSGVVTGRTWIATFDSRVRDTHADAHGQTVGLDEDFTVGGVKGAGPGMMGSAKESVACRCTTIAVLDTDEKQPRSLNGHDTAPLVALARVMGVSG